MLHNLANEQENTKLSSLVTEFRLHVWCETNSLLPEQYPEDVSHQQDQAHVGREALCVLGPADVSVLGDVGHHSTEHHSTSSDPRHQRVKHGHHLLEHLIFHDRLLLAGSDALARSLSDVSWPPLAPGTALQGVYPPPVPRDDLDSAGTVTSVFCEHNSACTGMHKQRSS